jgi:uncharacterized protein YbcI
MQSSSTLTKGQVEAQIAERMTRFQREDLGRGPEDVRVWIIQDLILVRLRGVLTPAERTLGRDAHGQRLVKQARRHLLEGSRARLDEMVHELTGVRVVSLHSDVSSRTGERIIVFTLAENLEERFVG